jgi:hypothetical protein
LMLLVAIELTKASATGLRRGEVEWYWLWRYHMRKHLGLWGNHLRWSHVDRPGS